MGELVVVLLLAMFIFGARRLPQIGAGFGHAIRNFKRGLQGHGEIDLEAEDPKRMSNESGAHQPSLDEHGSEARNREKV